MKIETDKIVKKNKLVDEVIFKLKQEFVGIDEQIEQIMNNVRAWFIYPEFQNRPLIVNLWGMSGTGKTDLVCKIAKYLNIEKDLAYFNFAEINEMQSYEVEQDIEDQLGNDCANKMFVYDEFQYAATIDKMGAERDNRSGLKVFWELMDNGILHKRNSLWGMVEVKAALETIKKINSYCHIEIDKKQSSWINQEECLKTLNVFELRKVERYLNIDVNFAEDCCNNEEKRRPFSHANRYYNGDFFIGDIVLEKFYQLRRRIDNKFATMEDCVMELLYNKSIDEIIQVFDETLKISYKGYDLNYKGSIIFVIGNLDEAYDISFNVNPDMSPDQFNKVTKKITIVDIKESLKQRFRNEQIARLGNIHIIYPSFSRQNFKDLIELSLAKYADDVYDKFNLKIKYDETIKKCIYNEAVYPTHGARPIFSTIHELIKSKLPFILQNCKEEANTISSIEFCFKNKKTIINVFDDKNNKIDSLWFKDKLRLAKLRESVKDEQQALCAVHESGHFVVYTALNGKMPEKLVSRTAETNTGGFLMEDDDNIKDMMSLTDVINEIQVCLGGYVAEKMVFGEDYLTNGACSDLSRATTIASRAIREWGFGKHPYLSTYLLTNPSKPHISGLIIKDNDLGIQNEIIALFEKALRSTEEILNNVEWKKMLKESSKYLSQHTDMPRKKMQEIYDMVDNSVKVCHDENYYRNKIDTIC